MSKKMLFTGVAAITLSFVAAVATAQQAGESSTGDSVDNYNGDAARGETLFKKCKPCHSTEPNGKRVGPTLYGVVGRTPGSLAGYRYSAGMVAFGETGAVWDDATLFRYLAGPRDLVPKTKMIFKGFDNPQDRADVIAYLKSLTSGDTQ